MAAKGKGGGGSGGARGGPGPQLALVGAVLFVVAWFVPVARGQAILGPIGNWFGGLDTGGGLPPGVRGPDWLPGLQACDLAWQLLTGDADGGDAWKQRLAGSTCLTNVVMLAGLVALAARRRTALVGVLLLGCAALNACWLWLDGAPPADTYGPGYWLWLASFALVGLGAALDPRRA